MPCLLILASTHELVLLLVLRCLFSCAVVVRHGVVWCFRVRNCPVDDFYLPVSEVLLNFLWEYTTLLTLHTKPRSVVVAGKDKEVLTGRAAFQKQRALLELSLKVWALRGRGSSTVGGPCVILYLSRVVLKLIFVEVFGLCRHVRGRSSTLKVSMCASCRRRHARVRTVRRRPAPPGLQPSPGICCALLFGALRAGSWSCLHLLKLAGSCAHWVGLPANPRSTAWGGLVGA